MMQKSEQKTIRLLAKRKQLWLEISLPPLLRKWVLGLEVFFSRLDGFLEHARVYRWLVTTVAGIGLGFGYSMVAFSHPSILQARPEVIATQPARKVIVEEIILPERSFPVHQATPKNSDIRPWTSFHEDQRFGSLNTHQAIVLADVSLLNEEIEKLKLGDVITLRGSNNGLYSYAITEVRKQSLSQLTDLIAQYPTAVILYGKVAFMGESTPVIIAQQQRLVSTTITVGVDNELVER